MTRAAAALTIGEVLAASAAELDLERAVVVLRGPKRAVESAARSLGAADVEPVLDQ